MGISKLKFWMREINGLGDRGREHTEQSMMALRSLERAIAGIRFIEENAISVSQFRELFPAIWDNLNEAGYHLRAVSDPTGGPRPMFVNN
jgi:hypothetical protein